jgi:hypothetical protein
MLAVGFFKTLKLSMSGTLLKRVDAHTGGHSIDAAPKGVV